MGVLEGKVALITGSARGVGAAIARRFVTEGARVALHGRDFLALSVLHAELSLVGRTTRVVADVTSFSAIEAMRRQVEEELGPIDILVTNTSGHAVPPGAIEDISEGQWRSSIDANLTATFLTMKSILPGMKQRQRGVIITMSATSAHRANARSPVPYAAAKAGIEILTKDVAQQAGPHGIRVNCIAPETILTERSRGRIDPAQQRMLAARHPLKRLGVPEDVAGAALFLASEDSAWITGVVLDIAGGA